MNRRFKIKKFFIKNFYRLVNPFRRFYWRVFKPKTTGVKCLIKFGEKFLLVRNNYGKMNWTTPGGGAKKNEDTLIAACREAQEEVGIKIENPVFIGSYDNIVEHKRDTVFCYYKEVFNEDFIIDPIEVYEAFWFLPDELPENRAIGVGKIIEMYKNHVAN